jgi:hypothetical protein
MNDSISRRATLDGQGETLRDFRADDAAAVNQVALAAFEQYRQAYADWATFSPSIGNMAALADAAELIVAATPDRISGAVAYVGPHCPTRAGMARRSSRCTRRRS